MKVVKYLVIILAAAGAGFFAHNFLPSGGAPAGTGAMAGMQMPPASVTALELKQMPLDVFDEYIASVEPVQQVMIRTEVSGYIDQVHFKEGAFVQQGDLLFTIDQKQYKAQVQARQAELANAEAELSRAEKYLKRMQEVSSRSVSETEIDTAQSNNLKAVAALKQAKANLHLAQIDLEYSEIHAPISGRIGAANFTKGNYVTPASDALARIVQTDPIRVVFSISDRKYYQHKLDASSGSADSLAGRVRLPNGALLDITGTKDFDDNAFNASTGTLAVRYLFDNPDGLLVPGGYVNILLGQKQRPMGIMIPQKALLADPDGNYVLTAAEDGTIGVTRIQTGKFIESNIEIISGLKPGDKVVVDGVQKVKPGEQANVTLEVQG